MKRSIGLIVAVIAATSLLAHVVTAADPWPSRFVRLIVPFSAGGAADVVTRVVAGQVSANLGKNFVVENRTGANGNIGTVTVARSAADGYTFLVGSPGTLAINPNVFAHLPYDIETDFVPVAHVAIFPQVLAISTKLPVTTLEEFIAYAKSKPDALNFGSSGIGSTGHLITAMFLSQAGIRAVHIPFRGGGPAAQALVSSDVDFVIDGLPTFQGLLETDRVKVVAITSAQRWPGLPNVPSIGEQAVPGFDLGSWVVFAAPKGTPGDIVDTFAKEITKALEAADVRKLMTDIGAIPVGSTPGGALAFQRAELAKWKRVVEISGTRMP
jgi:tripartite-type tricarboxylate transporter receptor subunit TctC